MIYKSVYLFIFLMISLASTSVSSQDLSGLMTEATCKCIENTTSTKDLGIVFEHCFTKELENHSAALQGLVDQDSEISEYEQGRLLGQRIFFEIQEELVDSCSKYRDFFESLRNQAFTQLKSKFENNSVQRLTDLIEDGETAELYFQRGSAHFVKDHYDLANKDYDRSLALNSNFIQSTYFKAWILEKKGLYSQAAEHYRGLYDKTGEQSFLLFAQLAQNKTDKSSK